MQARVGLFRHVSLVFGRWAQVAILVFGLAWIANSVLMAYGMFWGVAAIMLLTVVATRTSRLIVPTEIFQAKEVRVLARDNGLFRSTVLGGLQVQPNGGTLELGDHNLVTRVFLGLSGIKALLSLCGNKGLSRIELAVSDVETEYMTSASYLVLRDRAGKDRLVLTVNEARGASIILLDANGQTVWSTPEERSL